MKLRRAARILKKKAVSSLREGLEAFNGFSDDGRITSVLLHLQHACEMLLKAALVQRKVKILDQERGHSYGFKKCLNLGIQHCELTGEQAGVFRVIDSLRDGEQHWIITVSEDALFLHARGLVTAFDEILDREFDERLADHLPTRVLPVSTMPEANFDVLVDRECTLITELLAPGRRARDEARGRIRALLAMEGHVASNVEVSERDINRIEKALKGGRDWREIFPRLTAIVTQIVGTAVDIRVHFTKQQGIPVQRIGGDDPAAAAAVREVDLQRKFRYRRSELAAQLRLNANQAKALRDLLGIEADPAFCHVFVFGSQRHPCFSDQALIRMREALLDPEINARMDAVRLARRRRA